MSDNLTCIKDALIAESFTLKEIKKFDLAGLQSWIVSSIGYMLEYYGFSANENVEKSITVSQITMLTNDICEKYQDFTMADLIMCFKLARQNPSRYGKFYGRFDASVVMGWLEKYSEDREEVIPTLPENNEPVYVPRHTDMSREEYKAMLLSMAAAGDSDSYKRYEVAEEHDARMNAIYNKSVNYRWHKLHKYDNDQRRDKKWQR